MIVTKIYYYFSMCRVLSFVSVQGGVGKTTLVFELGKFLSEQGKRVCLVDGCFGFNVISQIVGEGKGVDICEYFNSHKGADCFLNKANDNMYFVKTNNMNFDYIKHFSLISFFIKEIECFFDYIIIDVSCDVCVMNKFFNISKEVIIVVSETEECVVNSYKLILKLNSIKNIYSVQIVLNKAKIVCAKMGRCLGKKDIEKIFKKNVLIGIPMFYKYNYLRNKKKKKKVEKIFEKYCYTIITEKPIVFDYENKKINLKDLLIWWLYEK